MDLHNIVFGEIRWLVAFGNKYKIHLVGKFLDGMDSNKYKITIYIYIYIYVLIYIYRLIDIYLWKSILVSIG